MRRVWTIVAAAFAVAAAGGCRAHPPGADVAQALQRQIRGGPVRPVDDAVWKDVAGFYQRRDGAPAWITDASISARGRDAMAAIATAPEHGLDAANYEDAKLAALIAELDRSDNNRAHRVSQLAEFDARLTTSLMELGRDVAIGRAVPAATDPRWKRRRTSPDVVASVGRAHDADFRAWLDALEPVHPEYAQLRRALTQLRSTKESGGWPEVEAAGFTHGRANAPAEAVRRRLAASGDLPAADASHAPVAYDSALESAIRQFQERHDLHATGLVDADTIAAMNVPVDARIWQIAINMDRWRWMPDDFGPRHVLVNIPSYELAVHEDGQTPLGMRVVVGKVGHETPVFSSAMTTVVLSPYWNIPDTIVAGETAPAVARDHGYLERNGIEILKVSKSGPELVNPSDVHWDDPQQLRQLAFRQRPGEKNALGHVKFLFPNDFDVYLHDTPADALFARDSRAFSHGCVRIENPEGLANYVLRDDPEWDASKIHDAMNAGTERQVKLRRTLPVHIVYFTAWVDGNGRVHFQPDVYGYDKSPIADH